MKCLLITRINDKKIPYAKLVISGKKKWDIRKINTTVRGRIGILFGDTILGTVILSDVKGPLSARELSNFSEHMSTYKRIKKYSKGKKLYAWVLKRPIKFKKPIKIKKKYVMGNLVTIKEFPKTSF
jgi:hypothetical protein